MGFRFIVKSSDFLYYEGGIMRMILIFLSFSSLYALQEQKHHHHHDYNRSTSLEIAILKTRIKDAELQLEYQRDERNYERKKTIALITLATTAISGTIAIVVYLLKS